MGPGLRRTTGLTGNFTAGGAGQYLSNGLISVRKARIQGDERDRSESAGKSCKGIYKSVINATRAAKRSVGGAMVFVIGEDLTCQAGLAVQQDLALGALLGITHAERNGHHYVDGFADAPSAEAQAFLAAHPDLYRNDAGTVRLRVHDGDLLTDSLTLPGFASVVHPDWSSLLPLAQPATKILSEQST
jgi:hypothetical protein